MTCHREVCWDRACVFGLVPWAPEVFQAPRKGAIVRTIELPLQVDFSTYTNVSVGLKKLLPSGLPLPIPLIFPDPSAARCLVLFGLVYRDSGLPCGSSCRF